MTDIRLPAPAAEALMRGEVIEAIRLVRQSSGLDLAQARDLVQRYQQQLMPGSMRGNGAPDAAVPAPSARGFVFPPEASAALAKGEFIQAIAALRRANPQLDLKSAKQAVDTMRHGDGSTPAPVAHRPMRVPTVVEGDRGGHGLLLIALVAIIVAIAWWWLGGR